MDPLREGVHREPGQRHPVLPADQPADPAWRTSSAIRSALAARAAQLTAEIAHDLAFCGSWRSPPLSTAGRETLPFLVAGGYYFERCFGLSASRLRGCFPFVGPPEASQSGGLALVHGCSTIDTEPLENAVDRHLLRGRELVAFVVLARAGGEPRTPADRFAAPPDSGLEPGTAKELLVEIRHGCRGGQRSRPVSKKPFQCQETQDGLTVVVRYAQRSVQPLGNRQQRKSRPVQVDEYRAGIPRCCANLCCRARLEFASHALTIGQRCTRIGGCGDLSGRLRPCVPRACPPACCSPLLYGNPITRSVALASVTAAGRAGRLRRVRHRAHRR